MPEQPLDYATPPPSDAARHVRRVILAALVFIVVAVVVAVLPSLSRRSSNTDPILRCRSNLRQIGLALNLYAIRADALPPTLQPVFDDPDHGLFAPDLACLATRTIDESGSTASQSNRSISYVYVAGGLRPSQLSPAVVLAYEPLERHGGKRMNVLFGDYRVETLVDAGPATKSQIDDLIRQAAEGIKPVVLSPLPR